MPKSITTLLRGIGQVMLQSNALTGLFFLIGIFFNSFTLGIGALLGTAASTFFAHSFGYDKHDIENGLYGYNGTLVGIAVFFFFQVNSISAAALVCGALLSTIFMHMIRHKIPEVTAPFVVSAWIIMFALIAFRFPEAATTHFEAQSTFNFLSAASTGFGQVMLQNNILTGLFFFFGILANSPLEAGFALYGSVLGAFSALVVGLPLSYINIGLFGFNAVLTSIALGGRKLSSVVYATLGILLSVFFYFGLTKLGVIALTAPFVIATWIVLAIRKRMR